MREMAAPLSAAPGGVSIIFFFCLPADLWRWSGDKPRRRINVRMCHKCHTSPEIRCDLRRLLREPLLPPAGEAADHFSTPPTRPHSPHLPPHPAPHTLEAFPSLSQTEYGGNKCAFPPRVTGRSRLKIPFEAAGSGSRRCAAAAPQRRRRGLNQGLLDVQLLCCVLSRVLIAQCLLHTMMSAKKFSGGAAV